MKPVFYVSDGQIAVYHHDQDEQLGLAQWTLPTLDLPATTSVHIRVVFNPPQIHLSPLFLRQVRKIGESVLQRIIERRIETESAWMRRFVPPYKQLPRTPAAKPSSMRALALRALGLDALADYGRFLTHYPPARVWEISDLLRSATPRFIEPNLVDSPAGWDRRIPPQGELRRQFTEFVRSPAGGSSEISLLEILGLDSLSLATVMEQWPERYGPRRRLLVFNEKTLPEDIWEELLGSRVNASLAPDTSDTANRLLLHLRPLLQNNSLAATYVLALMGFTLLQRSNGLASLLDPQLENTAIPANATDDEVEDAYDLAAKWIDSHQRDA
jgi:hypothetical protein